MDAGYTDPQATDAPAPDAATHVVIADGFAQIPEPLLYDATIPAEAVRVYGVLLRYGSNPSNCYPSHARIAAHIGKSARSVPAWTRTLEDKGWIVRVQRWRLGNEVTTERPANMKEGWEPTSNAYIVYGTKRAGERGVRAGERVPLRAGERVPSALGSAPRDSQEMDSHSEGENPQPPAPDGAEVLTLIQPSSVPDLFDAFWQAYPLRRGKDGARKAWAAAIKRAAPAVIIEGARRYAAERAGQDPAKTKYPQGWLNDGRWADERLPQSTTAGPNRTNVHRVVDDPEARARPSEVLKL